MRLAPARRGAARALAFVAAALAAPAVAGPTVLVELFTSQGCSSCPPADELLHEIADRPEVIALSLHVDYWDYLGWRDVFAQPAFSQRQMGYRDAAGARSVYTPQMVVDGAAAVVGSRRDKVHAALEAALARPDPAEVRLERDADGVRASVRPAGGAATPPAVIWFVTYRTPAEVEIERGENAGRSFRYRNVAQSWMKMGLWDGAAAAVFDAPEPPEGEGVAVIVQAGPYGPVLGAAKLEPR